MLKRNHNAAFSLIEILIVIAVIAVMAGGMTMAVGAMTRSKVRSSALRLVSASRFAYHHAIVRGRTVRIALSFEDNSMAIEVADRKVSLQDPNSENESEDGLVDAWRAAESKIEGTHQVQVGRSGFGPITNRQGEPMKRYKKQKLSKTFLRKVITPHEREERTDGNAYLYFFPGGYAENAVVQLSDEDQEQIYSVIIDELTGKGRVVAYAYEADDLEADELEMRDTR